MPMVPFYEKFRDLAFQETRSITLLEDEDGLPAGNYGFLESYCDEPGCDCRGVFINVVTPDMKPKNDFLATINYGWEDLAYYTKWLHGDKQSAREMKEPSLSGAMVRQSRCIARSPEGAATATQATIQGTNNGAPINP